MKNYLATILLVCIFALSLSACGGGNGEKNNSSADTNALSKNGTETVAETASSESEAETEKEVWSIFEPIECEKHHRDYHLIPYHLAKHIGIDESNKWADDIKESVVKLSDEVSCSCPDFNIRKYIDDFKISREVFISYGDMINFGTYNTDVLFDKSQEEVEEYFIYSDALIDQTIKSQHFAFIMKHFEYEYTTELFNMIVYDEAVGIGIAPSVPEIVQALEIKREAFEAILKDCTEQNNKIYGRSYNFDYDLDLIYNEDGSFRTLPTYEGLSEYETVMKLNRMFTGRDN